MSDTDDTEYRLKKYRKTSENTNNKNTSQLYIYIYTQTLIRKLKQSVVKDFDEKCYKSDTYLELTKIFVTTLTLTTPSSSSLFFNSFSSFSFLLFFLCTPSHHISVGYCWGPSDSKTSQITSTFLSRPSSREIPCSRPVCFLFTFFFLWPIFEVKKIIQANIRGWDERFIRGLYILFTQPLHWGRI